MQLEFALDVEELLLKVKPFRRRFGYKLTSSNDKISLWQKLISQIFPEELENSDVDEITPEKVSTNKVLYVATVTSDKMIIRLT